MFGKVLIIAAAVAFCLVNFGNAEHNIDQCADPDIAVELLCSEDIKESGKFARILKEVIDCPATGLNSDPITCIKVTNKMGDDGGNAQIVSGGINYYSVEILLESQWSKGLDYHIEVYTNPSRTTP
ncbi:uncharacterized protein [Euwallacea fornicatus]|uniref:uncharacterized protein n=1 Tax=Euwallacea fornicatus TaxID=995702 RepID=UPI00338E323F